MTVSPAAGVLLSSFSHLKFTLKFRVLSVSDMMPCSRNVLLTEEHTFTKVLHQLGVFTLISWCSTLIKLLSTGFNICTGKLLVG